MHETSGADCTAIVPYTKKKHALKFESRIALLVGSDLTVCIVSAVAFRIPLSNLDETGTLLFLALLFLSSGVYVSFLNRVARRTYRREFSMPRSHREAERWEFFTHRVADFTVIQNGLYIGLLAAFVPSPFSLFLVFLYAAVSVCRLWKSLDLQKLGEGPVDGRAR